MIERKIGEVFEFEGKRYKCVEGRACEKCAFNNRCAINSRFVKCTIFERKDRMNVMFEETNPPKLEPSTRKYFVKRTMIMKDGIKVIRSIQISTGASKIIETETEIGHNEILKEYSHLTAENFIKTHINKDDAMKRLADTIDSLFSLDVVPLDGIISGKEEIDKEDTLFILGIISAG